MARVFPHPVHLFIWKKSRNKKTAAKSTAVPRRGQSRGKKFYPVQWSSQFLHHATPAKLQMRRLEQKSQHPLLTGTDHAGGTSFKRTTWGAEHNTTPKLGQPHDTLTQRLFHTHEALHSPSREQTGTGNNFRSVAAKASLQGSGDAHPQPNWVTVQHEVSSQNSMGRR